MKKSNALTVIAIIGAVLLILGLIVSVIGFALGGRYNWRDYAWNWGQYNEDGWHWSWGGGGSGSWTNLTDYNATYETDKVTALDLDFQAGKLEIVVSDKGGYDIKNYPAGALQIHFVDGKLSIKDTRDHYGSISGNDYNKTVIKIYITQDHLASLEVEMGVGQFIFKDCTVDYFEQDMGVADSTLTNITALQYDLEGGVGSLTYHGCDFANVNATIGTGDFEYNGKLSGECYFEGGVGAIRMTLTGTVNDYYFVCSQGIGSIRIGDSSSGGLGLDDFRVGDSASPNQIEIESGIGDIDIAFQ